MKNPIIILAAFSLALAGGTRQASATLVNSNSVVRDNIEYIMQTDKSVYNLGENVQLLYEVINRGSYSITFHFNDQVQYYFTVKDNGNLIWDAPKVGFPALSSFTLPPGYFKQYTETWNMRNNQGLFITPGSYEITGSLDPVFLSQADSNRYVPVSVQIGVIPEPATVILLGLGGLFALSRRHKKAQ